MIQKFFSMFFVLIAGIMFIGNSHTEAAGDTKVAVILETPDGMFSEPEVVYKTLNESLDKMFKGYSQFDIIPVEETNAYVQVYLEESELSTTQFVNGVAVTSGEPALKKANLSELDKHFEADYLLYVRVYSGAAKMSVGLMSASQKVNVTTDFRVWSAEKADYVYMKRFQATGKSTAVYAGLGSSERAVEKGLKKGLSQVEADAAKIRAAMM